MTLPKAKISAAGKLRLNFKALKIILLVAAILALWSAGILYFNDESPIKGPSKDRYVLMLLGTDVMFGINRSDTIMVGFVDAVRKKATVVSVPRDTRVDIPGIGIRKINAAYALGSLKKFGGNGVSKATEVVQSLLGVTVDYYAKVDLSGFITIIDALGGIEIEVESDMHYEDKQGGLKIDITKGRQILSGQKSMEYVRYREKMKGDLGRIERQQKFIKAVVAKLKSPGIILKIPSLAKIIHDNLTTNMRLMTMLTLAELFKNFDRGRDFSFHTLPGEAKYVDKKSFFIADMEKYRELSRNFFWDGLAARVETGSPDGQTSEATHPSSDAVQGSPAAPRQDRSADRSGVEKSDPESTEDPAQKASDKPETAGSVSKSNTPEATVKPDGPMDEIATSAPDLESPVPPPPREDRPPLSGETGVPPGEPAPPQNDPPGVF